MASPVVHFEIRAEDPDEARAFFGPLFSWSFPEGGMPGYTYVDTGVEGAVPGGIGPVQGGAPLVTFFVGVEDVAATLTRAAELGGKIVQAAPEFESCRAAAEKAGAPLKSVYEAAVRALPK